MRTHRSSISFLDDLGREVAELVDDRVSSEGPAVTDPKFREIEVELRDGAPAGLVDSVAGRLGAAEPHVRPKLVRALGGPAEGPPDVVSPDVDAEASSGNLVRAAIASSVLRLLESDPGTRLGKDPEGVHQCRVAVRRLRSDLRTFGPLLDEAWTASLRDELKWLGGSLGGVRDADVLLEGLRERALALPDLLRRPAERLLRRLRTEHDERREALLEDMRGDRYSRLLDRLVEAAAHPALTPDASESAESAIPALAASPWHALRKIAEEMPEEPADEDLHRLRIKTKRARYAAEAVQTIGGRPVARFAKAAEKLQDVLGKHQDAVVSTEWLRRHVTRASGPVAFAAGALATTYWTEAAAARQEWPKAWKRLAKRTPKEWE
jgi:CHAD domain-containing protein